MMILHFLKTLPSLIDQLCPCMFNLNKFKMIEMAKTNPGGIYQAIFNYDISIGFIIEKEII